MWAASIPRTSLVQGEGRGRKSDQGAGDVDSQGLLDEMIAEGRVCRQVRKEVSGLDLVHKRLRRGHSHERFPSGYYAAHGAKAISRECRNMWREMRGKDTA